MFVSLYAHLLTLTCWNSSVCFVYASLGVYSFSGMHKMTIKNHTQWTVSRLTRRVICTRFAYTNTHTQSLHYCSVICERLHRRIFLHAAPFDGIHSNQKICSVQFGCANLYLDMLLYECVCNWEKSKATHCIVWAVSFWALQIYIIVNKILYGCFVITLQFRSISKNKWTPVRSACACKQKHKHKHIHILVDINTHAPVWSFKKPRKFPTSPVENG